MSDIPIIFNCTKCGIHYVLPSCCDHYQQAEIEKLKVDNEKLKKSLGDGKSYALETFGRAAYHVHFQWIDKALATDEPPTLFDKLPEKTQAFIRARLEQPSISEMSVKRRKEREGNNE